MLFSEAPPLGLQPIHRIGYFCGCRLFIRLCLFHPSDEIHRIGDSEALAGFACFYCVGHNILLSFELWQSNQDQSNRKKYFIVEVRYHADYNQNRGDSKNQNHSQNQKPFPMRYNRR